MRLINTKTLKLEEIPNEAGVRYAILSHRWEDGEVTFDEMQSLDDEIRRKKGFDKISKCCTEAQRRQCPYAWVDTCCIDKRSSAELSEAINSMFRWYQNSEICFAYLSDVGTDGPETRKQFRSSKWFERGWTLQELLAPSQVFFYNSAWLRFGTKHRLVSELVEASGIAEGALLGTRSIFDYSIAQRMYWASKRKTTRVEDRAYSLMGLFNVNMAMLYGEGEKAFMRLQEEIIKHSDDPTIFAWTGVKSEGSGLLAPDVTCFAEASNMTTITDANPTTAERQPWVMTNQGLFIELSLTTWSGGIYMAILDCQPEISQAQTDPLAVGIFLQRIRGNQFRRILTGSGDLLLESDPKMTSRRRYFKKLAVYVRQDELSSQILRSVEVKSLPVYGVKILPLSGVSLGSSLTTYGKHDVSSGVVEFEPGQYGPMASFALSVHNTLTRMVQIGLNFSFRPKVIMAYGTGCDILAPPSEESYATHNAHLDSQFEGKTKCVDINPRPANHQFQAVIEDDLVPGIFVFNVPDDHDSYLIHVRTKPIHGGRQTVMGAFDIRRTAVKGRKLWSIGVVVF